MELVLHQRQELNLIMTNELRQAISLLQYSTYELYQYIKEQELENPLIELEEQKNELLPDAKYNSKPTSKQTADLIINNEIGMRDNLLEQAKFLFHETEDRKLVGYLIHNLDDNGYLDLSNYETFTDRYDENEIDRGIQLLQHIGPRGIGARNLKECLLLQLTNDGPEEKLAECLIHNHLNFLANRKWGEISSRMNIPLIKVQEIYDFILTLNPKPCSCIADFSIEYLTPDIIVEIKESGISYYLNDSYLPAIHLNNQYVSMLNNQDETSKYISDQYTNYQWLLSSIEQRRQTILKIVKAIIKKQERFFKDGFIALEPLTLKEIAEEIEMHESTVSRATMNKVIQTPTGTFDLKIFFSSKLENADGSSISQSKVKALLKTLIEQENKCKPFSDQKIADYFHHEKKITISRRTITKYREELNIPSSVMRKQIKIKKK